MHDLEHAGLLGFVGGFDPPHLDLEYPGPDTSLYVAGLSPPLLAREPTNRLRQHRVGSALPAEFDRFTSLVHRYGNGFLHDYPRLDRPHPGGQGRYALILDSNTCSNVKSVWGNADKANSTDLGLEHATGSQDQERVRAQDL